VTALPTSPITDSVRARWLIALLSTVVTVLALLVVYMTPRVPTEGTPSLLANLNAVLNAAAGVCLTLGFVLIRKKRVAAHRACMLVAFGISCLFLVTYLLHHAQVGSVPFRGQGLVRTLYFAILIPHIVLAAAVVPLALLTLYRGLSGRVQLHRKIARITFPVWLFVSLSGVVVYGMLYYAV
jgi:putative membrane protein